MLPSNCRRSNRQTVCTDLSRNALRRDDEAQVASRSVEVPLANRGLLNLALSQLHGGFER